MLNLLLCLNQGSSATQSEGAAPSEAVKVAREGEEKPVRVRAGFQVYQPKRASRLSAMEESSSDVQQPAPAKSEAAKSGATTD